MAVGPISPAINRSAIERGCIILRRVEETGQIRAIVDPAVEENRRARGGAGSAPVAGWPRARMGEAGVESVAT